MTNFIRLFQEGEIKLHQTFWLNQRNYHYLSKVLRVKQGDCIILFTGQGEEHLTIIQEITKKGILVKASQCKLINNESPIRIHLAQGIARGEKMDMIIQKAVELGVAHIIPLITERCNVRLKREQAEKKMRHWQGIIISACEQSGRSHLPKLSFPLTMNEWLSSSNPTEAKLLLSPYAKSTFQPSVWSNCSSFTLLIGSEGGLTESEMELALQHGFLSFNLGKRILRTETATLTALSILQYQFGDLGDASG